MVSSIILLTILNYMIGNMYISNASELTKILLPSGNGHCLDGSPPGIFYDGPSSLDSLLWVFMMQGGGSCSTKENCTKRAKGHLGSSVHWPNTYTPNGPYQVLNNDPSLNPYFYDSHRVFIPYCTGDAHAGQRTTATEETWNLYFSGHINFMQIIDFLLADQTTGPSLKKAKQVLLAGASAGAIGAFYNVDYLADKLPWATVKGAPEGGWYSPGLSEDHIEHPLYPPSDWSHWSQGQISYQNNTDKGLLWDALTNTDCIQGLHLSANESFLCGSIHNLYPFIKSPLFVMENQYDKNQLTSQLGLPANMVNTSKGREFVAYFGRAMRNSTERQLSLKPKDGLFLPSCISHTGDLGVKSKTSIRGINQSALLGDWFFQLGKFDSHQIVDDCLMKDPGLPCNPTCPNLPNARKF